MKKTDQISLTKSLLLQASRMCHSICSRFIHWGLRLIVLMAILIYPSLTVAQTSTQVTIVGIPPILSSPFISDFEQRIFNGTYQVHLNIPGSGAVPVELEFRVEVFKDGSKIIDETSFPASFTPGFHVLAPFPDFVEFEATTNDVLQQLPGNLFQQVVQSGSFPEGDYTISMTANRVGASNQTAIPGTTSFMVRYPQPPTLLTPATGSNVVVQVPVFSWTPAIVPAGVSVEYDVLVVELFDGQNPGDAMLSNRDYASFQIMNNTIFPYTGEFLPLEQGRTYAWQIIARDAADQFPFKNEGRSEIFTFTVGEPVDDDPLTDDRIAEAAEPEFEPIDSDIPAITIIGNVNWAFKPTEGGLNIPPIPSNISQSLMATNESTVATAIDDPNYISGVDDDFSQSLFTRPSARVLGGSTQSVSSSQLAAGMIPDNTVVPIFGGGSAGSAQFGSIDTASPGVSSQIANVLNSQVYHPFPGAKVKAVYIRQRDSLPRVIATTNADENGNFQLVFAPSELQQLVHSDGESYDGIRRGEQPAEQRTGDTDPFAEPLDSRDSWMADQMAVADVRIVVESPYFIFLQETVLSVNYNNPQQYNAGTVSGTALTYRFQPEVINSATNLPVQHAVVEVLRMENWYDTAPELLPEGFPLADDEREVMVPLNRPHYKVAQTSHNGTISRLFPRKQGFLDRYAVRVSADGFKTVTTHLSASPDLTPDDVVIINRTYELQPAAPIVEGRVLRADNMASMKNATVTLGYGEGSSPAYVTMTDNEGRFIIDNITPRDEEYTLRVSGPQFSPYEEELLLDRNGVSVERDPIFVSPAMITVVGRVMNEEGNPVPMANVRWKAGGAPVQGDELGHFVTANTAGTHELVIRKVGHRDKERIVTIEVEDTGEEYSWAGAGTSWDSQFSQQYVETAAQWADGVMNTSTFQQSGATFNPGSMGFSGNVESQFGLTSTQSQSIISNQNLGIDTSQFDGMASYFSHLMGEDGLPGGIKDIGEIKMTRSVGRVLVTVEDEESGEPIPDATVAFQGTVTEGITGEDGSVFFNEAPGGTVTLSIRAPETTNYIPLTTEVTVTDDGDTTRVEVAMELGGRAAGQVLADGEPVENATIRLIGRDDISTRSDSDGAYQLPGIPAGEWELIATKPGLVGAVQFAEFSTDETETVDFVLNEAPFAMSTLLGFEIEVEDFTMGGDTTITGAFVSIPSNELFDADERLRLPFSNISVFEHDGELFPVDGEVVTDASEVRVRMFEHLYINFRDSNGLTIRQREFFSDNGFIAGRAEVDFASTFTGATGWAWPSEADQYLTIPNIQDLPYDIGETELVFLTSDGSFPYPELSLLDIQFGFGGVGTTFELYDFDINLNEAFLRMDGMHLMGDLQLTGIPLLDEASLTLEKLWIGFDGSVQEASFELDPNPQLMLANWDMQLNSGTIMEAGLLLGGALAVSLPGSDVAEVMFSELGISSGQIHGGQFSFPVDGVDIFGIASLRSLPGKDISMGKVEGQNVFFLSGGAAIGLPQYIDRELEISSFFIRTDGELDISIAANFEADFFGLADLSITGVRVQNTNDPYIRVDGQFGLYAIPFITAQAGGLTYRPGGAVSVDQIDLGFEIAGIAQANVGIEFIDDGVQRGFNGHGMLNIDVTPISAAVQFQYLRQGEGIFFGAQFEAGLPPIPVGNFSIENIGGGFTYNSAIEEYSVTVSGAVAILPGTSNAISLNPLEVTVRSGPVIEGTAGLSVLTESLADVSVLIDFPDQLFDVQADLSFNRLEDIETMSLNRTARLVISGDPDNQFWMAGVEMQAHLYDLFNTNANILAAWNMNPDVNTQYQNYTGFVDDAFIHGGVITGVFLQANLEFGIKSQDQVCLSVLGVGEACGYFYNKTQCRLSGDIGGSQLGFYLGSDWEGGGNLSFTGIGEVARANAWASGEINGLYSNNVWTANGAAEGEIYGYIGDCNVGCFNQMCWSDTFIPYPRGGSLCASAAIYVNYHSNTGMDFTVELNE